MEKRTEINSVGFPGSMKEFSLVFAIGKATRFFSLLSIFIN